MKQFSGYQKSSILRIWSVPINEAEGKKCVSSDVGRLIGRERWPGGDVPPLAALGQQQTEAEQKGDVLIATLVFNTISTCQNLG